MSFSNPNSEKEALKIMKIIIPIMLILFVIYKGINSRSFIDFVESGFVFQKK